MVSASALSGESNKLTGHRALCHDLMQYVTAATLVATMPDQPGDDPLTRHRFELIQRQLSQMHTVLQDWLDGPDAASSANVVELVRECVGAHGPSIPVDLLLETPCATATGDHVALRRAVNNVLDNALRAVREDQRVVVRVSETPEHVQIDVRDTGVGFGRLASGRGLGMVSVAEALGTFGGSLEIRSGPEPGTLVRLQLPRAGA